MAGAQAATDDNVVCACTRCYENYHQGRGAGEPGRRWGAGAAPGSRGGTLISQLIKRYESPLTEIDLQCALVSSRDRPTYQDGGWPAGTKSCVGDTTNYMDPRCFSADRWMRTIFDIVEVLGNSTRCPRRITWRVTASASGKAGPAARWKWNQ